MGLSTGRVEITPQMRRKSFLKMVYEHGYTDGYYLGDPIDRGYQRDDAVHAEYMKGVRIGRRERDRVRGDAA